MNEETTGSGTSRGPSPIIQSAGKKPTIPLYFGIIGLIAGLAIAGALAFGLMQLSKATESAAKANQAAEESRKLTTELEKRKETTGEENIDKDQFQAVFLEGGQVYFGTITKITELQLTLEDIYYLRVNGPDGSTADINNLGSDVSLVKLGCELHGPEDIMQIERKKIQFYENLKEDGQVAKAIKEYKAQNPEGQDCAAL